MGEKGQTHNQREEMPATQNGNKVEQNQSWNHITTLQKWAMEMKEFQTKTRKWLYSFLNQKQTNRAVNQTWVQCGVVVNLHCRINTWMKEGWKDGS